MKCPNCGNKIAFTKIRGEFSCPYCSARLKTKNYMLAFIAAVFFWAVIFSPIITIRFKGEIMGLLLDMTIGFLVGYIIFRSLLKLEKIM
jgi:hypothetical protein